MEDNSKLSSSREHKKYWNALHKKLFGSKIPKDYVWTDLIDILYVLNLIAQNPTSNQIYSPEGTWTNLRRSDISCEPGFIELGFVDTRLVKPRMLVFDSFDCGTKWNYFRLITQNLEPTGLHLKEYYEEEGRLHEYVYQIGSVKYAPSEKWKPDQLRSVQKESTKYIKLYFGGGDYVIASPASPLKPITKDDPTLHQRKGDKGFKELVQGWVDEENAGK